MQEKFDCISVLGTGICIGNGERLTISKLNDIVNRARQLGLNVEACDWRNCSLKIPKWHINLMIEGEVFFTVMLSATYKATSNGCLDNTRATNKYVVTHMLVDAFSWMIGVQKAYGDSRENLKAKMKNTSANTIETHKWTVYNAIEYMGCKVLTSDRLYQKFQAESMSEYAKKAGRMEDNFHTAFKYRAISSNGRYKSKGIIACTYQQSSQKVNRLCRIEIISHTIQDVKDLSMTIDPGEVEIQAGRKEKLTFGDSGVHRRIRVVRDDNILQALASKYIFSYDKDGKFVVTLGCSKEISENMSYKGKEYGMFSFEGSDKLFVVEKYIG